MLTFISGKLSLMCDACWRRLASPESIHSEGHHSNGYKWHVCSYTCSLEVESKAPRRPFATS